MTFAGAVGLADPLTLQREAAFRQDAQHRYDQARSDLTMRRRDEGQAREALQKKHQAEESLQILREKEEGLHKKTQQEAEDAFLDEQAISGSLRNRS